MRSVIRSNLKNLYSAFCAEWRKERYYQESILKAGGKLEQPKLGKKPTFKAWMQMNKTIEAKKTSTPEDVQDFINDTTNLEWSE